MGKNQAIIAPCCGKVVAICDESICNEKHWKKVVSSESAKGRTIRMITDAEFMQMEFGNCECAPVDLFSQLDRRTEGHC